MIKNKNLSLQTRINWLIDTAVFVGAVLAAISGIYFLFLPSGGYQGGRNPWYGIRILFDRQTWDAIHTWGSITMMVAVALHLLIHTRWLEMIGRRLWKGLRGNSTGLSSGGKVNVIVDLAIAVSFAVAALSGIYFLFAPSGGFQGGANVGWDSGFIFRRTTWDLIHTWSGIAMIAASIWHLAIHWRWVCKVTKRFFSFSWARSGTEKIGVMGNQKAF